PQGRAGAGQHRARSRRPRPRRARVPAARAALPCRRGGDQAVPRHRHRAAARGQHPRGRAVPRARVRIVYVDNDPMVLARALLVSAPGGAVGYVDAYVREPATIIAGARDTLDFSQPVAVLLLFTLAYVGEDVEAARVVSALMAALAPGSYLALYHLASDVDPDLMEAAGQWNTMMPTQPITPRSHAQVAELGAGLEPVLPGLTPVTAWRPAHGDPDFGHAVPIYGLVARKPSRRPPLGGLVV